MALKQLWMHEASAQDRTWHLARLDLFGLGLPVITLLALCRAYLRLQVAIMILIAPIFPEGRNQSDPCFIPSHTAWFSAFSSVEAGHHASST